MLDVALIVLSVDRVFDKEGQWTHVFRLQGYAPGILNDVFSL